ncbi:hypothetical protein HRbin12_00775 [bacterium HR12]|nr:hypothetical protein HRbin12_00775 [bacterium HR12]
MRPGPSGSGRGVRVVVATTRRRVVVGVLLLACLVLGAILLRAARERAGPAPEGEPWVIVTPGGASP